jgi:hypothetical protein
MLLTVQGVCFDLCKVEPDIDHLLKVLYDMLDFQGQATLRDSECL